MADSILFNIAEGIIGRLGSAAVREIGLLWGVNNELSGLEDTILTIKAILLDAEEKKVNNHQVKIWLSRLEDVVYEADDLLSEVSYEALSRQVVAGHEVAMQVCTFFSTSNQLAFRYKMAHKIKALKEKLDVIRDDRNFHLEERHEETKVRYRAREHTHSFVSHEEVIIGRDYDRMKILDCLLDTKNEGCELVIPIVGCGGLGKTTLARLVFNDEKVEKHFDLKMWVCVSSTDFDVRLLVEKIIRSTASNERFENFDMESLQKDLRQKLSGKRFLLVLDDVWNENRELWLQLRNLLLNGTEGSRIIVTTRSTVVAKIMSKVEPYFLGNLDETQSWSLFKKMAFIQGEEPTSSSIVEIGKKIVKKCGGIPLAIRTVGRMLYFKNSETEWSSFHNIEFSKISQDEHDILPTLELSYNQLSSHLKHCFAYCSLFPKDHEINVKDLVNLWIAQGFIKSSTEHQSPEDVGHDYFMELYWKSFFQEVEEDMFGNIQSCKMHDLMHDLAIQVAGAKCVMFPSHGKNIARTILHVSFDFCLKSSRQIPTPLSQTSRRTRTILLPSQPWWRIEGTTESAPICDVIVSKFKFLRILDLHNSGIKTVSDSIGKLKHLRYLDLSNTKIKVLPNSITQLHNLQTLKLSKLEGFREFPRDMKNLINLRHLEFKWSMNLTHMPCGLGQMTNLRTLSQFVLSEGTNSRHGGEVSGLKELMALNNLRGDLWITKLKHAKDAIAANLKEKQHLQCLRLDWYSPNYNVEVMETVDYEMILEGLQPHPNLKELRLYSYEGVRLSIWLTSLKQLVSLVLKGCIKCESLPPLNQFPSLKSLTLFNMLSLQYISNDSFSSSTAASLPSLEHLDFKSLPNLKGWWKDVTDGEDENSFGTKTMPSRVANQMFLSFPCLSTLLIEDCPKMRFMPFSPHIKSLKLENPFWNPFHQILMSIATRQTHQNTAEEPSSSTATTTSSAFLISSISLMISNLTYLCLCNIEDLQNLPNWLNNLSSLNTLRIKKCPKLKNVFYGTQHLASLQYLYIEECDELDMSNADVIAWKALKSLHFLHFFHLPKMETLPEGIQHVTNLQILYIEGCNNFTLIPESISNLTSLTQLTICECPNLTSLPEGFRNLTSLQRLSILGCPILSQRCQKEKGQDWHKIAHVPDLLLKYSVDDSQSSTFSEHKWKIFKNFRVPQLCNK